MSNEKLGLKKVVYREDEDGRVRTVKGFVEVSDNFFIVSGTMWINKNAVIAVKDMMRDDVNDRKNL